MWTGPPVLHAHGKGGENGGDVTCLLRGGGEGGTTETRRERAARERGHGQSHHECSQGWVHSAINLDRHVRAGVRASRGCETACYIREPAFVVDTASIRRPTRRDAATLYSIRERRRTTASPPTKEYRCGFGLAKRRTRTHAPSWTSSRLPPLTCGQVFVLDPALPELLRPPFLGVVHRQREPSLGHVQRHPRPHPPQPHDAHSDHDVI